MIKQMQELKEKVKDSKFSEEEMEKIIEKIGELEIKTDEIQEIKVVNRNNDVRFKLLEKAMYNVINEVYKPQVYILPMQEDYNIISKEEFNELPDSDPLKQKIPIFMHPFGGKMDFEYWIYDKEGEQFISKIKNRTSEIAEGTGIDLFKHFSSKEDVLSTINVAFMGLNASEKDIEYIKNITKYYKSRFGDKLKSIFMDVEI